MEALEKAARAVGGSTEFTSKAAAEGLEFLAMAGFNSNQAMSVLPSVVDLATGANTGFSTGLPTSPRMRSARLT